MFQGKKGMRLGRWIAVALLPLLLGGTAAAEVININGSDRQSGYAWFIGSSAPLTMNGWNFAGQDFDRLGGIDKIEIRLTLFDGDTAPGNFDFGDITLGLDGIDTGIRLDGFRNLRTDTLVISGTPQNADAILAALQADGLLTGSLIDHDPNDSFVDGFPFLGNFIIAPAGSNRNPTSTSLGITGPEVPEPATWALFGSGLLGVWWVRRRRVNLGV